MSKIVFTLCSNNYLSHAKTLGDSVKKFNPEIHFVIGLVDKQDPSIDYGFLGTHEILTYDSIGYQQLDEMLGKYNIIEFNTAVKPFYFDYFFKKYGDNTIAYYIDPDIEVFSSFEEMDTWLQDHTFLITPHLIQPTLDVSPFETQILRVGVYNLGFIGIKNSATAENFLAWWKTRLEDFCFNDKSRGLFVDQKWINLLPVLFNGVKIIKSPGYNMGCWNFHERKLLKVSDKYFVNSPDFPLVFFHYSGFKPTDLHYICKIKMKEFTLAARPDLADVFTNYALALFSNRYKEFSLLKPRLAFGKHRFSRRQKMGNSLKYRFNTLVKKFFDA